MEYLEVKEKMRKNVKRWVNREFKEEVKKRVFLIVVTFMVVKERLGVFVYFGFVSQRGEVCSKHPLVKS